MLKRWSGRPLASITQPDVRGELVEAIDDGGAPVSANRTLAGALKTLFKFYVKRELLTVSPAALVDRPAAEESRDRVLSDDELRAVWKAANKAQYPFGRLVQMLLSTGARRDELREAPWTEFDLEGGIWKLPAERAQERKRAMVPLSDRRCKFSASCRASRERSPFHHDRRAPFRACPRPETGDRQGERRHRLDLHDLRRTAATGMAELGTQPHVIEAAEPRHREKSKRGVAGIYNRSRYADEIRKALQAWADHVGGLVNGAAKAASNVVRIR